jgi:hypothetical protein
MTPLEIQIAINYVVTTGDFRDGDFSAPAVRESIDWFVEIGFLRFPTPDDHAISIYVATDMCRTYVKKLCSIPLPKQKWVYED